MVRDWPGYNYPEERGEKGQKMVRDWLGSHYPEEREVKRDRKWCVIGQDTTTLKKKR